MIDSSYRVDGALFDSFEILWLVMIDFGQKDIK